MNSTQLAQELGISKGRVSQYVAQGKLDGCFSGEGRARRFDLDKVRAALQHRLDPGQMLGNGAETKRRLQEPEPATPREGELRRGDPDRYELARIQKVEEEARKLRRQNLEAEGTLVLADRAAQATARALAQEVAEFEGVMRRAARAIADQLGVDFKEARKILIDTWREHRRARSEVLAQQAASAGLDPEEREADF
jgi:hypothetical protein